MEAAMNIIKSYRKNRRIRQLENALPTALYQMASLSSFSSIDEMIKSVADSNHGPLSEEFSAVYNEIKTGASFEDSLQNMINRNDSEMLTRGLEILIMGYETGADISSALKETAEDIAKTFDLYRQRSAGMTIERYTLLMAAGIIVPLILGIMVSMVTNLDINLPADLTSISKETRTSIMQNSILGNQIYLGTLSLMVSFFVAHQENKPENFWIYIVLVPISLVLFNLMKTISLI